MRIESAVHTLQLEKHPNFKIESRYLLLETTSEARGKGGTSRSGKNELVTGTSNSRIRHFGIHK